MKNTAIINTLIETARKLELIPMYTRDSEYLDMVKEELESLHQLAIAVGYSEARPWHPAVTFDILIEYNNGKTAEEISKEMQLTPEITQKRIDDAEAAVKRRDKAEAEKIKKRMKYVKQFKALHSQNKQRS